MENNKNVGGILAGIGAGAVLMYLFDPDRGNRRRAILKDKTVSLANQIQDGIEKTGRDLSNRTKGIWVETQKLFSMEEPSDRVLEARVRSEMGRVVSHPHAVKITSEDGHIIVEGVILASEVQALLSCIETVPGVKSVTNNLEEHDSPEGIPSLQGGSHRESRWEFMQENWSPAARLAAGAAASAAIGYGLSKRDAVGLGLGAVGAVLLLRSASNIELKRLFGTGGGRRAVTIHKSINVNAPPQVLFNLWSNFENFPKFMTNVLEVKNTGKDRSHWKVAGPAGTTVEWDAEITRVIPNELIAWKSVEGSTYANAGYVMFEPNKDGSTEITVRISYNPPAGAIGHTAAVFFGTDPKSQIDEDLMRMKSMLEKGRLPHDASQKTKEPEIGQQRSAS